jgi:hypothetical protein
MQPPTSRIRLTAGLALFCGLLLIAGPGAASLPALLSRAPAALP